MTTGLHKRYESKRDGWIVALILGGAGMMVFAAVSLWFVPAGMNYRLGMTALMLLAAAFMLWVLYGTYYVLEPAQLAIHAGPFHWRVPLEAIEGVTPTHNPLSSPACSLDRLRIRYRGARFGVMISPMDKMVFLHDLAAATGLRVEGERLVKA